MIFDVRTYWYGKTVVIGSLAGWNELYGHMLNTWVQPGERVARGEIVGTCGNTGVSTGNHLHFEVRRAGRFLNPSQVLP